MNEQEWEEAAASSVKDMEATAVRMRELIVAMPPHDLLGYIYAQPMRKAMADQNAIEGQREEVGPDDSSEVYQFLLEYVHAVLASDTAPKKMRFDESRCVELFELSRKLHNQAMYFSMASSAGPKDGIFGPDARDIEVQAKFKWVGLRGNRCSALEGEFYSYVLAPHDDALKEVYGAGATDIAKGFQDLSDALYYGHAAATAELLKQMESEQASVAESSLPPEDAKEAWKIANSEKMVVVWDNMFRGGVNNVSRHTSLPETLLEGLAYRRGEETDFFAEGDFSGTPYRTLPVRMKPLIQLGSDYYAIDPCFIRDSGYRALLYNLLGRKRDYEKAFQKRQQRMSESAFADILSTQLPEAKVKIYNGFYYKDPISNEWCEADTLILMDDVLFLVEAKSGAAATIASPVLDPKRHARSVEDLVIKAYEQCERFFEYLASADEVVLYSDESECKEYGRVRRSDYRVMLPIGLTVESLSPFSAYCKELPEVKVLLGKHAFISLSIDELFVLRRFLRTPGSFVHYMEVRQAAAGIRKVHLTDEFDHLGAYLEKNRFDKEMVSQLKDSKERMIFWEPTDAIVNKSFVGKDWESRPFPTQKFPEEVLKLFGALDSTRADGWLAIESHIRNSSVDARNRFARMLSDSRQSLSGHPVRCFSICSESDPLFVCLQQRNRKVDWAKVNDKASAVAVSEMASNVVGVLVEVSFDGIYHRAESFPVHIPKLQTKENAHIYEDADRMFQSTRAESPNHSKNVVSRVGGKKIKPNDPCPCGSLKKYKKCHGR